MLREFRKAVSFLTLIPLPACGDTHGNDIKSSLFAFPLVGLLIGLLSAGCGWLAGYLFGSPLHIVAALAAATIITAGFHLDGLADSCDALFSWRDRPNRPDGIRR